MDFNLVVVSGRLAAPPEPAMFRNGATARMLLTVRSFHPAERVDLLPVRVDTVPAELAPGDQIWIAGALQRHHSPVTGRSRIEVVARQLERRDAVS